MDAQYVVDIAASMTGGDQTAAELDTLTADLMGAGKGADFFQEAIKQVSSQLQFASVAAETANAALDEGNARYAELEKAALNAAKAAEKAALKNSGVVPPEQAALVASTSAELESYGETLRGLEKDAKLADAAEKHLGDTLKNVKTLSGHVDKSFNSEAEKLSKLRGALNDIGAPFGGFIGRIAGAQKGLGELSGAFGESTAMLIAGAAATAAVVIAVVALTAALVVAVVQVAAWAVGLADARREADLTSAAAAALDPSLGALSDTFAAISAETGAGAADLRAWRKTLEGAKVAAADMPSALRAVALGEAALGKGQGVAAFTEKLREAKGAVGDVTGEFEALAPIVQQKLRGLDAQSLRFQKNISELFGGLNIEPVLAGLETLVALFDQNTIAGQTIKYLFESVFQPLIDQAQNAAYVVEAFALGFLIGLTKVYIAVKPVIRAISELFGFDDTSLTDTLDLAKTAGELIAPVFLGIVAAIGATIAIIGLVVAQLMLIPAAAAAVVAAAIWLGAQVYDGIVNAFAAVRDFLNGLIPGFGDLGMALIEGLVSGLTGGASQVISAITGVAKGAIAAAKAVLGIHSPSTVFAGIGDNTVAGYVGAVEDGTGDAQVAMADMVAPPDYATPLARQASFTTASASSAPVGEGAPGAALGKSGSTINFNAPVYFAGKQASKGEVAALGEMLTRLLEGDAASLGAELVPA